MQLSFGGKRFAQSQKNQTDPIRHMLSVADPIHHAFRYTEFAFRGNLILAQMKQEYWHANEFNGQNGVH